MDGCEHETVEQPSILGHVSCLATTLSHQRLCLEIVSCTSTLCLHADADRVRSAKRMYYPQTYHHVQEIQKYNIQDYRPRYVGRCNILHIDANLCPEWSNSKRQSAKCDKSSECGSSAGTPFRKRTSRRGECWRPTIRPKSVVVMASCVKPARTRGA